MSYQAGIQSPHAASTGLPYLLSLPILFTPSPAANTWPLLIYLHGAGESGTDPMELLSEGATGTPPVLSEAKAQHLQSYIVVSPQTDQGWSSRRMGTQVVDLLDELLKLPLGIDPTRVILTGVSMGGAGTFSVAAQHPHRFAAVVPVCGAPPREARWAHRLRNKSIWIWHGANDAIMPVQYSDEAEQQLKQAGSTAVKYTRVESAPAPVGWPHYTGHAVKPRACSSNASPFICARARKACVPFQRAPSRMAPPIASRR